jgi:hypothetical protein
MKRRKVQNNEQNASPKTDIDRLYVKRKRGRGKLQIEATNKEEIINTTEYLNIKYTEDQFVNIFLKSRMQSTKYEFNN